MKMFASAILVILTLVCASSSVFAETLQGAVESLCPNGSTVKAAFKRSDEAEALHDSDRSRLHKASARELYRCSTDAGNLILKEYATYLYGVEMLLSFDDDNDVLSSASDVARRMNNLAASSKDEFIKSHALDLKTSLLKLYTGAIAKEFPSPSASAT